jgi:hypothetical protein
MPSTAGGGGDGDGGDDDGDGDGDVLHKQMNRLNATETAMATDPGAVHKHLLQISLSVQAHARHS